MSRSRHVLALAMLAGAQALGCQIIEAADKIHNQFDSDEDETIRLSVPEPVAVGSTFEVEAIDACTDRARRCETDRIEVTRVVLDGPFVSEELVDDVAVVRATGAGDGLIDVTVSMDGSSPSAIADLRAEEVLDVALDLHCVGGPSTWVARGRLVSMTYTLYGFREQLGGTLEPPVDTALTLERLGEPGQVTYRTPDSLGPVPVVSTIDDAPVLTVEVFGADQVVPEIVAPPRTAGSTLSFRLEERVDGARPCVESEDAVTVRSETPSVCMLLDGLDAVVEVPAQIGDAIRVDVVRAGTCSLAVGRDGRGAEVTRDFDLAGP